MTEGFEIPSEPIANSSDIRLIQNLSSRLLENNFFLSTAESCTGGGIGYWLTSLPGSSDWYSGGYVSYSNAAKIRDLDVSPKVLERHGAVSEEVAEQMAIGCAEKAGSSVALSVTGIAGPDGGTVEKPVGTVCFGWVLAGESYTETKLFTGDRSLVRNHSIRHALTVSVNLLEEFSLKG